MDLERKEILIELCEKLLDMRMGDKPRITTIMKRAQEGKILYELDKKYLEKKAAYIKFETSEPEPQPEPQPEPHHFDQPLQDTSQQKNDCLCETCGKKIVGDPNFCGSCGAKILRKNEIKLKTMECNICHFKSRDKEQFRNHFDRAFHNKATEIKTHMEYNDPSRSAVSPGTPPTDPKLWNRLKAEKKEYQTIETKQAKKFPTWVIVIGVILGIGLTLTVAFPNGVTWILWVPILIGYGGLKLRFPKLLIIFLIFACFFILGLVAMSDLFMNLIGNDLVDNLTEREKILEGLDEYERQAMITGINNCQYNAGYQVSDEYGDEVKQDCMEKLERAAANMRGP